MTKITIHKTKTGEYLGFTCEGHAGYADSGKDIVCAAISMLVINTVNSFEKITEEPVQVKAAENTGTIECLFTQHPISESSKVLMDSLVLGLTRIEQQYGKKHCRLHFKEV